MNGGELRSGVRGRTVPVLVCPYKRWHTDMGRREKGVIPGREPPPLHPCVPGRPDTEQVSDL